MNTCSNEPIVEATNTPFDPLKCAYRKSVTLNVEPQSDHFLLYIERLELNVLITLKHWMYLTPNERMDLASPKDQILVRPRERLRFIFPGQ